MSEEENKEPEVKFIERHEVAPAGGDDVDDPEKETQLDSSQEKTNDEEGTEEDETPESDGTDDSDEEEPEPVTVQKTVTDSTENEKYGEVKPLQGETKREFALRIENARLREQVRGDRAKEILTPAPAPIRQEISPERKKVLERYKPEDVQNLKEILDVMGEDMGFVRKDQLGASSYQEKATEVLDDFLEKHPEYLPQNDPGNILWNRFRDEYGIYKQPENPRALKKILDKIHKDVFGIQPASAFNRNEAAKEKINVASHSSSSRPAPSREGVKRNAVPQGLRTDMLKGFSDEEIADLTG